MEMDEILRKKIEQAAIESRMASAETLTTFGMQSSIDDVVELTGMELSYDEVAERAFEKGAEYALSHQWISVDEALPEYEEDVLALIGGAPVIAKGYHVRAGLRYNTHWMPVPKFKQQSKM